MSNHCQRRLANALPAVHIQSTSVAVRARCTPSPRAAAVVLVLGAIAMLGPVAGCLVGIPAATAVLITLPRMESSYDRSRRIALAEQGPAVVDLLAACLASGAPLRPALQAVAEAIAEPARGVLRTVVARLDLGEDPVGVWLSVATVPGFGLLAPALARAVDTGAPLAQTLPALAEDVRVARRARIDAASRRVGVRLTAPLGLMFLPAFILLGVVPVVASLISGVLRLS